MADSTTRHCVYCQQDKAWIWSKRKLKDGSKIYVDQDKRRWAGRRCPQCERSRVQAAVHCDGFERGLLVAQLEAGGYEIITRSLPMKVKKNDKILTVGIKRATTRDGAIILESPVDEMADIYALVFESVRICSADQMTRLSASAESANTTSHEENKLANVPVGPALAPAVRDLTSSTDTPH